MIATTPAEPHTAFVWPTHGYTFDIDERIDSELFEASTRAWGLLDDTLNGLRVDRSDEAFSSRILVIYYATRIYGVTVATAMLFAHRLGREAIMAARSQYEYFIKMLYYDHRHADAKAVTDLLEAHDFRFAAKVGRNVEALWSPEDIDRLNALSKEARKQENFTNEVFERLRNDETFLKLAGGDNPFATWFFQNLDKAFATHWTYGSTIVHASPVDLTNVVVPRHDGHFNVNVDSRMKAPNKMIADVTQRCFSAMGLIRWRFGLEFSDAHIQWAQRFSEICERHKDEPTDIRSMHD
ncbi:MAG: hypothetical protein ACXWNK_15850 [Vulcanimicrobiaceae bacterium]